MLKGGKPLFILAFIYTVVNKELVVSSNVKCFLSHFEYKKVKNNFCDKELKWLDHKFKQLSVKRVSYEKINKKDLIGCLMVP